MKSSGLMSPDRLVTDWSVRLSEARLQTQISPRVPSGIDEEQFDTDNSKVADRDHTGFPMVTELRRSSRIKAAMRLLLFMLGIWVVLLSIGMRAEAQNYPWCAYYSGRSGGTNCGFMTFQQCMDTARGFGSNCQPNTQYRPPPGPHPLKKLQDRYPY